MPSTPVRAQFTELHPDGRRGFENDLQVQPEALRPGVLDVELNHFVESGAVFSAYLPQSG
jgi:hypothetical protein